MTLIGLLVLIYYGLVGLSCTVYYRRALTKNIKGFVFAGAVPLLSALSLFAIGIYSCYSNWTSTDHFEFNAANGRFLVVLPAAVVLSAIPALLWTYLRRHPKYMSMPTESAPSTALSPQPASAR